MNARKLIGVLSMMALLMGMMVIPASAESHTVDWDRVKGTDSEKCELADDGDRNIETGWLHWVLTPGGETDVTEAELFVNGISVGTMSPQGGGGALQLFMPYVEPITAYAVPDGDIGNNAVLTISDWCPGVPFVPEGNLSIEKDAEGTYEQPREWDLDKKVWNGLLDGEGEKVYVDETTFHGAPGDTFPIEWQVDVDLTIGDPENHEVTGTITVGWVGNYDIEVAVTDSLPGAVIDCEGSGSTVTLEAPLDSVECDYTVSTDGEVATNTATVTAVSGVGPNGAIDAEDLPDPLDSDPTTIEWTGSLTGDEFVDLDDNRSAHFDDPDEFPVEDLDVPTTRYPTETLECSNNPDDYDADGFYTFDVVNTATLKGDITDLSESATVTIECQAPFVSDTVTGDGLKWRGTVAGSPNTWFEYSPFEDTTGTLIQGRQRNDVGSFEYDAVEGEICFSLTSPYELTDVEGNVKIQPLDEQPTKYLQPGQFELHFTESGSDFCVPVPEAEYGYAIHLDAGYYDFG